MRQIKGGYSTANQKVRRKPQTITTTTKTGTTEQKMTVFREQKTTQTEIISKNHTKLTKFFLTILYV